MYKTIVVPLDSSERAEKVLPHVEALCGVKTGKIILVHVIEPTALTLPPVTPSSRVSAVAPQAYMDEIEAVRRTAEEYLSRVQSQLKSKGIDAETVIETGPTAERIVHIAEERNADLIALTSHGRTGLSRVFFGSVAAAVLHRSETPLLLVRARDDEPLGEQ